jgi:uncharacterized membrane protein
MEEVPMASHVLPARKPFRLSATSAGLLGLTALTVSLVVAAVGYTGQWSYVRLLWNLFLAWVPLGLAWLALRPTRPWPLQLALGLAWLLFLPNAPYLVTDLMHLRYRGPMPVQYDVVLLFAAALSGMALGLVSLQWMQRAVAARLGEWAGRLFALFCLGAAGFGVYLGRYGRWNSWDVLARPVALGRYLLAHLLHPRQHWQAWALTLLFAVLMLCAYWPLATAGEGKRNA